MTGRAFAVLGLATAAAIGVGVGLLAGRRRRPELLGEVGDIDGGVEAIRAMPKGWWQKAPPVKDKLCYGSKTEALNKFREWNQGVVDDYGGMSSGGSGGEFDALTKWGALPKNLAEAFWLALPPERVNFGVGPFCLDQIDVGALNETSAGRDHPVGFQLPDFVMAAEIAKRERQYHRTHRAPKAERPRRRRRADTVPF